MKRNFKQHLSESSQACGLLCVVLIALIFVERPLHGYSDPGSGLLLWQVLAAAVIGVGYQVRRIIQRLRHLASPPVKEEQRTERSKAASSH